MAERLVTAEGHSQDHVSKILTKLGLADRTQAAVLARQQGIVDRTG